MATDFGDWCVMKVDANATVATGGCCLACRHAPASWTRFERIGGGVWHEGRYRKLRQTVRADKTDCCRWAAKREANDDSKQ